jgi:hypothetical protein
MKPVLNFLRQLICIDQTTGKLSHTKFLSVIAGLVMIGLFPYVIINNIETSVELWLVFGTLFLSNRQISKLIERKYTSETGKQ